MSAHPHPLVASAPFIRYGYVWHHEHCEPCRYHVEVRDRRAEPDERLGPTLAEWAEKREEKR